MVTELKSPTEASPGVLIFTHKERPFLFDPPGPLADRLHSLSRRYVVGMHWGSYHEGVGETPFVDFHLAAPGTVTFAPDADVRHVPLCDRDFTPAHFRPMDVPQAWDILAIGHPIEIKRMHELLDVVRDLYDHGHEVSVLLVCAIPGPPETLGPEWDHRFFEKYRDLFSPAERDRIQLAAPVESSVGDRPLHPIPNEVFPYLYNASRTFTLFSQAEGQSKVIHEALVCGTPVVVREDLRGGGRDYLDERNSRTFADLEGAREAFVGLLTGDDPGFDPAYLRRDLSEEYTVDRLESELRGIFADLGEVYAGSLDRENLSVKLSSHRTTLPPALRRERTDDLRSRTALYRYLTDLLEEEPPAAAHLGVRLGDYERRVADVVADGPVRVAGAVLRGVDDAVPVRLHGRARALYRRLTPDDPGREG